MLHVYGSVIDGFEDLAANVLVAGNGGVAVVGGAGIGDGHVGHIILGSQLGCGGVQPTEVAAQEGIRGTGLL